MTIPEVVKVVQNDGPSYFLSLYVLARCLSHIFPSNTIAFKVCAWILGHVPAPAVKP